MTSEHNKRPIDLLRDGAGSFDLTTPGDSSDLSGMIVISDSMYVVKKKGIYELKMADQIDPDRTNAAIPNTIQKILNYGSEAEWIGKTLLTAQKLLNKSYLPEKIDCEQGMLLMLEIVKDIEVMQELACQFEKSEIEAMGSFKNAVRPDRSVILPNVGEVSSQCKTFIQRADHVLRELYELVKHFYGANISKKWFEGFTEKIESSRDTDDNFGEFLRQILPLLQLIRNARNCVEHPRSNQKKDPG